IGWAWALVLTELYPDRADAILARGRAFGDSRVICNVHWHSDVSEGRVVGAAVVARLHADATFRSDLEASRIEVAHARPRAAPSPSECSTEAAALNQ
ncbi:MAG: phosphatase PAP2 family protein, partial [Solirubrobacteraceae bacterium]